MTISSSGDPGADENVSADADAFDEGEPPAPPPYEFDLADVESATDRLDSAQHPALAEWFLQTMVKFRAATQSTREALARH